MTNTERFIKTLNGEKTDRVPMIEWATWWEVTTDRWEKEGMPKLDSHGRFDYLGLDDFYQFWLSEKTADFEHDGINGYGSLESEQDYERIKKHLFSESYIDEYIEQFKKVKPLHDEGKAVVWYTIEGFFWFPRTLFGIENHLYAFYDYPELMHRINKDHLEYALKVVDRIYEVMTPEFMTLAEDMSYNLGPMLSKELYDEFMKPYYDVLVPYIKSKGTKVFIDTDGDVQPLIDWFLECGIQGILPLERQSAVDVCAIREKYPDLLMIGGFDKRVMQYGEEAMRTEFERILPAMKAGRYIASVDHQTPPDVSLENYKIYVKLLKEYCEKAMQ